MPAGGARLSIVIVSYNTRVDLERCLRSLRDTPPAIELDVVVVDNASEDGSAGWVRTNCPAVRVLEVQLGQEGGVVAPMVGGAQDPDLAARYHPSARCTPSTCGPGSSRPVRS